MRRRLVLALLLLGLAGVLAALSPRERWLGASIRIVFLHGAWVWTAIACLGLSAVAGLLGLLNRSARPLRASAALGLVGMAFWITYLPLSAWAMKATWGGLFLVEPRWRLGVSFAALGLAIQATILVIRDWRWAAGLNLVVFAGLAAALVFTPSVLHPESPVFTSGSPTIVAPFLAVLACCLGSAGLLASDLNTRLR